MSMEVRAIPLRIYGLAAGIYHYTVLTTAGTLGNGRLAIER